MGIFGSKNILSKDLDAYMTLTYLTEKEIYRCYEDFVKLAELANETDLNVIKNARIDMNKFIKSPLFQENPFRERIFAVFGRWNMILKKYEMQFEDYLNMMSVFSSAAPALVKSSYAFDIYDFDGLGYLTKKQISNLIIEITGGKDKINHNDLKSIKEKAFEEADFYKNKRITLDEFEQIVGNSREFARNFSISVL